MINKKQKLIIITILTMVVVLGGCFKKDVENENVNEQPVAVVEDVDIEDNMVMRGFWVRVRLILVIG